MLHQSTSRRLCRTLFLLLAALPLLLTLAFAYWWTHPSSQAAHLARIERHLGVRFEHTRFGTPRPTRVRYEQVTLRAHDSAAVVLTAKRCDAQLLDQQLQLVLVQPKFTSAAGPWLQHLADRLLVSDWPERLELQLLEAEFADISLPANWRVVAEPAGSGRAGRVLKITSSGSQPGAPAVAIQWVRNRQTLPAATQATLDTGPEWIPVALVTQVAKLPSVLLPGGQFRGRVVTTPSSSGRLATVEGALRAFPLAELLPQATGLVELPRLSLTATGGRIETLAGDVAAHQVTLTANMMRSLVRELYFVPGEVLTSELSGSLGSIAFDRVALRLELGQQGLTVWTADPTATTPNGPVGYRGELPLLESPPYRGIPVASVIRSFWPANELALPATREAVAAGRRLPLPAATIRWAEAPPK